MDGCSIRKEMIKFNAIIRLKDLYSRFLMTATFIDYSGDVLSIDTASITGEPLPRNYPSDDYGSLILCGTTVKAGEVFRS